MAEWWDNFEKWRKIPPTLKQLEIIDRGLIWLAVIWIYLSVALSIVRWQQLSGWDIAGLVIGIVTALGYWFRLKTHKVVQHFIFFVLALLAVFMCTMLLAGFI